MTDHYHDDYSPTGHEHLLSHVAGAVGDDHDHDHRYALQSHGHDGRYSHRDHDHDGSYASADDIIGIERKLDTWWARIQQLEAEIDSLKARTHAAEAALGFDPELSVEGT